jgi:hypothetical protein
MIGRTTHVRSISNGSVIHYADFAAGLKRGPVEQISLERFGYGHTMRIRRDRRRFDSCDVVERARLRLGESRYVIVTNNCQ